MESILVNLVTLAGDEEVSIVGLIAKASPIVKGVLVVLVLLSLFSWYVIVYKWLSIRRAQKESQLFLETFWQSKRLDEIYQTSQALQRSPISQIFRAGYVELSKLRGGASPTDTMREQLGDIENITRALRRAQNNEVVHLESMTQFLATTASAAPFVGLFGTVWGIMNSFINIAHEGNATLPTVAPGIAEALVATAIGLVAAIPAVAAYNFFINRIRVLVTDMENFGHDFLNIVKRHFFK